LSQIDIDSKTICRHCGDICRDDSVRIDDDCFCCNGCKQVFQLLNSAKLGAYYSVGSTPGLKPSENCRTDRFAYLDDVTFRRRLLDYVDGSLAYMTLSLPQIHCPSCILLLENLYRLDPGIECARVNYLRRELKVTFNLERISLRQLVELLASIGYEPDIHQDSLDRSPQSTPLRSLYLKTGIAGFAFANIMLLNFPYYLNIVDDIDPWMSRVFQYLAIALALPVLLYSARDYFIGAIGGLRSRILTIDVPLALGIAMLFARSVAEIFIGQGHGYLDSFAGLVFFLLVGKLFQYKTYDNLSFDRDYKAYFPVSVTKKQGSVETTVPVTSLRVGDRIVVRNQELVPADAIMIRGQGQIDYSFVTGESRLQPVLPGMEIRAGGRQVGGAIEVDLIKEASQSYLTSLWNNASFHKDTGKGVSSLSDLAGKYFTMAVLLISSGTALYWLPKDPSIGWQAITSVLIVACPCAIALSLNFVMGTSMRALGTQKLYLKNASVVESLSKVDTIVFDKTGTLTCTREANVNFVGEPLSSDEESMVASLVQQSTHPLSRRLAQFLNRSRLGEVRSFVEKSGEGISGVVHDHEIRLGRHDWVIQSADSLARMNPNDVMTVATYLSIDGEFRGAFRTENKFRDGIGSAAAELSQEYELLVLSGDNNSEQEKIQEILGNRATLVFNQSPHDKLERVDALRGKGKRVLMVGDGLNDAGALRAADVGIAVSEDAFGFTPASDAILDASQMSRINQFLVFSKRSVNIVYLGFAISGLYNLIGLGFAVRGQLSPLVSAILMPASSISVVLLSSLATRYQARRSGF
jgi:P-type Cu+ transporter